jgi:hypothetical protein
VPHSHKQNAIFGKVSGPSIGNMNQDGVDLIFVRQDYMIHAPWLCIG